MNILSGIVLFVLIWWSVIFTTLPFGNKRASSVTPGHAGSAPVHHHMRRKVIATTLITCALWYPLHSAFVRYLDYARAQGQEMADADTRVHAEGE